MKKALWIVLDGGDRVGKSTQRDRLADDIRQAGIEPIMTRDPGGSPKAEAIRDLLLSGGIATKDRWNADSELTLFTAARLEVFDEVIRPHLDDGRLILGDRWVTSTRAYQCFNQAQLQKFHLLNTAFGLDQYQPDLTLILDAGEDALNRVEDAVNAAEPETEFEARGRAYHQAVQQRFRDAVKEDPDRRQLIDARGDLDTVTDRIRSAVNPYLRDRFGVEIGRTACPRAS